MFKLLMSFGKVEEVKEFSFERRKRKRKSRIENNPSSISTEGNKDTIESRKRTVIVKQR